MWITQRNLRKNVKRMNILKRAGNKSNLPFNTEEKRWNFTKKVKCDKVFEASKTNVRGCRCRKVAGEESPGFTGQDAG